MSEIPPPREGRPIPILDNKKLRNRAEALRSLGVRIPDDFVPDNLDPSTEWFRGVLGELETAELLVRQFEPALIEIMKPSPHDVDIKIHTSPPHLLQIKDLAVRTTRNHEGEAIDLDGIIDEAVNYTIEDTAEYAKAFSIFTLVEIRRNEERMLTHSSKFRIVIGSEGIHLWIIEVAPEVLSETLKNKIRRDINKARGQLEQHSGEGILVPVLNMTRYGHCQKSVYLGVRDSLRNSQKLGILGGVLMITKDFNPVENRAGFHDFRLRFIGLANPRSNPDKRLDPYLFNPNLDDENVNEERRAIIRISPSDIPWQVKNDRIYVEGIEFGQLPRNYSTPDAVKVTGRIEPEAGQGGGGTRGKIQ